VELPITIVFEPPSRAELRASLRSRWLWVVAAALLAVSVGALVAVVSASRAEALASATRPVFSIRSRPSGAQLWIDGRALGHTPAEASLSAGQHRLELKAAEATDAAYNIQVGAADGGFEALVWSRHPAVTRVRSAVPGAIVSSVQMLSDGTLGVGLAVHPDQELQAWRLDPATGAQAPLLNGAAGSRLSVAPDGASIAFVGRDIGPIWPGGSVRNMVVWLSPASAPSVPPRALWYAPAGETLLDVTWAPDGRRLLASTLHEVLGGAVRTRLWLIEPLTRAERLLLTVPSEIVPGAFAWSPDGQRVALLAHAGALNALCVLELDGEFHYLVDLEPSEATPLPFPPLTWSADGQQALFTAPYQQSLPGPASWLQPAPRRAVYLVEAGQAAPRLVGEADASLAAWREDGQLVALARTRDGLLSVDVIGSGPRQDRLVELPLKSGPVYAAAWDAPRGRVLVATRPGSETEYWLIRLGLEDQP
jgi:PEGA domain